MITAHKSQHQIAFTVGEHEAGLLKDFLLRHKQLSRKSLSSVKHAGDILLNGKSVTVRANVQAGDEVEVVFPVEEESEYLIPEEIPLDILYEDEDILLINKRPGMCVHPTFSQKSGTLANGVMFYWQSKGWKRTFHAVNRLDKDTSGIVLLAQNRFSHQQLSLQQKNQELERKYYALVHGHVQQDSGFIEAPIGRKRESLIEREVCPEGQYAKTNFRVIQRYQEYTWLEIKLETGRTHQIRVHFSYIGHPLLGDDLYGGQRAVIDRQALHAYYTSFVHPTTKQAISFTAPIPEDMLSLM